MRIKKSRGFTLIELMIVVAIIGILAAVAIPKFANLITKSKESSVKGNLGSLKSAFAIYFGDTEGINPPGLMAALTAASKYLPTATGAGDFTIPANSRLGTPGHGGGFVLADSQVKTAGGAVVADAQAAASPVAYGSTSGVIIVNCTHADDKGSAWSTY